MLIEHCQKSNEETIYLNAYCVHIVRKSDFKLKYFHVVNANEKANDRILRHFCPTTCPQLNRHESLDLTVVKLAARFIPTVLTSQAKNLRPYDYQSRLSLNG